MKNILVDSSVWIDYFSGKIPASVLTPLIDRNLICINDLILSELVPFLKLNKQNKLVDLLFSINNIPIKIDWNKIIEYQCVNLRNGVNKVGIPDLIILQNVIDNNLELLTFDKHFQIIRKYISFSIMQ